MMSKQLALAQQKSSSFFSPFLRSFEVLHDKPVVRTLVLYRCCRVSPASGRASDTFFGVFFGPGRPSQGPHLVVILDQDQLLVFGMSLEMNKPAICPFHSFCALELGSHRCGADGLGHDGIFRVQFTKRWREPL